MPLRSKFGSPIPLLIAEDFGMIALKKKHVLLSGDSDVVPKPGYGSQNFATIVTFSKKKRLAITIAWFFLTDYRFRNEEVKKRLAITKKHLVINISLLFFSENVLGKNRKKKPATKKKNVSYY